MKTPDAFEFEFIFHKRFDYLFVQFEGYDLCFCGGLQILIKVPDYSKPLAEIIEALFKIFYLVYFFRDWFRWFH